MLYWYPKIKNLDIPQPKTEIYKLTKEERQFFNEERFPPGLLENIRPIISKFSYPVFVRTDFASGKHGWKNTCFVKDEKQLVRNLLEIISKNLCAGIFGLPFEALVFREYIPLDAGFKAFYGEMPIAREQRFFISNKKIQCYHPYWPKWTIQNPNRKDWESILDNQNRLTEEEFTLLSQYALHVGEVLHQYWSIDFAYSKVNQKWYLIDMALGIESFHWLECEFCPIEMRNHYLKVKKSYENRKSESKFLEKMKRGRI